MSDKEKMLLIALNGICEDALDVARDDPAANLDSLNAYELMGVVVPPFLRLAVFEFVINNSEMKDAPSSKDANVYFIHDTVMDVVKIGFTSSAMRRISQIQSHNSGVLRLLGTMPGGIEKEKELHERFSKERVRGEWFRATPELMQFIAEATAIN